MRCTNYIMRLRGIGIGEKVSAPVCVIDEQRCFTQKQNNYVTTYHVRWEEVALAFDSVIKRMASTRAADENIALSHTSQQMKWC
jgi:hypothetical protein